jgi:hypothetical protein
LAGHQDAFGLFDQRAAAECSLQALVLGEALQVMSIALCSSSGVPSTM